LSMREEHFALAEYWMEKADESLRAAKVLLDAGITGASMSRLYYAVFYAASALFAAIRSTVKLFVPSNHYV